MTYTEIQKVGQKIDERDFYDGGIYFYTKEWWITPNGLFIRADHSNANRYTGKTETYPVAELKTFDECNMMYFITEIGLSEEGYEKAVEYCKSLKA